MSKYRFGSIVNRDFRNTLQRLADDSSAQGKAIQDLVAEGQLTEEQYADLIITINNLIKSGDIDMSDLSSTLQSEFKEIYKEVISANERVDELVIGSGDANAEVTDAHVSTVKNQTFSTIRNRFESVEGSIHAPIRNVIPDSGFNGTLSGWNALRVDRKIEDIGTSFGFKSLKLTLNDSTDPYTGNVQRSILSDIDETHTYYFSIYIKNDNLREIYAGFVTNVGANNIMAPSITSSGEYVKQGFIIPAESLSGVTLAQIRIYLEGSADGQRAWIDRPTLIDLTETFGSGNEPTYEEMERITSTFKDEYIHEDSNLLNPGYIMQSQLKNNGDKIVPGKNLFDGEYITGTLSGGLGGGGAVTSSDGKIAIIPVKPNTTYTITKSTSNRFRVALSDSVFPTTAYIVRGDDNDDQTTTTVTTRPDDKTMIIYTAFESEAPDFMQVEEGSESTELVSYGYEIYPESKPIYESGSGVDSNTPEFYGAVGNADYLDDSGNVWQDAEMTIPATDDTKAIQDLLDFGGGSVKFTEGKNYLITDSLNITPSITKRIQGDGAQLVAKGDFIVLDCIGNLTGSANPNMSGEIVFSEHGMTLENLKVSSSDRVSSTALKINQNFGMIVRGCNFNFLKNGIIVEGVNRNLIFESNHIYACMQNGIYFAPSGDLHQINILGNHISYCDKSIFSDEHGIWNIQITGNDIEASSYPENATHVMHFKALSGGFIEDLEVVGNTIEDHYRTDEMVKFEASPEQIFATAFSGNVIGNAKKHIMTLQGVRGFTSSGNTYKRAGDYAIKLIDNIRGLSMVGDTYVQAADGGGMIGGEGLTLRNIIISNNVLDKLVSQNPIVLSGGLFEMVTISNNQLDLNDTNIYDHTKAMVDLNSSILRGIRIDDNTMRTRETGVTAINMTSSEIIGATCKDNLIVGIDENAYNFSAGVASENNISVI